MSHYVNEDGRLIVVLEDSTEVPVFATLSGGIVHCMTRAVDEATFDKLALETGLMAYSDPGKPAVIDPDTGEELEPEVPPSGDIVPASGNTVTKIGPYVITEGVYDDEGKEITPPVMDKRYHVNFWIPSDSDWEGWIVQWMGLGMDGVPNDNEVSKDYKGIELMDPMTINSPSNVLL